ncbi:MAG: GNAT family N-acetyltransferase [Alphaproteobacteria bacterium]|nr:MAG: GNAT family N-acetyltransferase [Alphaproteobacteria bacterium]
MAQLLPVLVRAARIDDIDAMAEVWHAGWHTAHGSIAPPALVALRTRAAFAERLLLLWMDAWVAEQAGRILGLVILEGDEVAHLFLDPAARGRGLGARLLAQGELVLARRGHTTARLLCARDNHSAARFYARQGWQEGPADTQLLDLGGASVTLPMRPFTKALVPDDPHRLVHALEVQALGAWPALATAWDGSWVVRMARGVTRRANSATPLSADANDEPARIDRVVARYRQHGLPPVIRLTPLAPPGLDEHLSLRGWQREGDAHVMVRRLLDPTEGSMEGISISPTPDPAWLEAAVVTGALVPERVETTHAMLSQLVPQAGFLRLTVEDRPAAVAMAVVQGYSVGLLEVASDPLRRRCGFGQRIVAAALAFGAAAGATAAWLQVVSSNLPAITLYQRMGFRSLYAYHYRIGPLA